MITQQNNPKAAAYGKRDRKFYYDKFRDLTGTEPKAKNVAAFFKSSNNSIFYRNLVETHHGQSLIFWEIAVNRIEQEIKANLPQDKSLSVTQVETYRALLNLGFEVMTSNTARVKHKANVFPLKYNARPGINVSFIICFDDSIQVFYSHYDTRLVYPRIHCSNGHMLHFGSQAVEYSNAYQQAKFLKQYVCELAAAEYDRNKK